MFTYQYDKDDFEKERDKILNDCLNGKSCDYGICDECPNILRNDRSNNDD